MYVCVLASGSKGNCTYISDNSSTAILVDAGLSWKKTKEIAEEKGINIHQVKAIIITHEHIDHYKGAFTISKNLNDIPVYFVQEALQVVSCKQELPDQAKPLPSERHMTIETLKVMWFETSHDTVEPLGILIKDDTDIIAGIATDLGVITKKAEHFLKFSNILLIDSNHDTELLWSGPYPEHLKMRIEGELGHLSNTECAKFVKTLDSKVTKHVILGHISEENNTIENIRKTFGTILNKNTAPRLHVANQINGSSVFKL
jgi:phosphoribosyl 1,2-cyclic phosphodiesterase